MPRKPAKEVRAEWKARGRCTQCGGEREKGCRHLRCEKCRTSSHLTKKRKEDERRANHQCAECGVALDADSRSRVCDKCAEARRSRTKALVAARKENGLCVRCGEKAIEGDSLCEKHAALRREYRSNMHDRKRKDRKCILCSKAALPNRTKCQEHSDSVNASHRRIRNKKREQGLCTWKGCNSLAVEGYSMCDYHLERAHEYRMARRERCLAQGLCFCGRKAREGISQITGKPYTRCNECYDASRRSTAKRRAERKAQLTRRCDGIQTQSDDK